MTDLQHHFVTTNAIKLHYVEQGSGPLVVMCHVAPPDSRARRGGLSGGGA